MTIISDLTFDLEEEILSKVSINSLGVVRSTCKRWRALCRDPNFTKKHRGALVYTTRDTHDGTMIFSLLNVKDLPSIKEIAKIHCPAKVWQVYVCDGLLLCMDTNRKLLLWNPYLAQTRYIEAVDKVLLHSYVLGYDSNNNPKILRIIYGASIELVKVKIYDLKSNSWRALDITPNSILGLVRGASLNGNTYFVHRVKWKRFEEDCLLCFDFTTETLRSPLHLPLSAATEANVEISSIRGEQLALLFQRCRVTYEFEFWITSNIENNAVSWTKLFKVDMKPLAGFKPKVDTDNFFVDKEKNVAVVCCRCYERKLDSYIKCYVVGEDGNCKELDPGDVFYYTPSHVCLST